MLEINEKKYAYMATRPSSAGYSMISMLFTISIIFISLPFVTYLLSSLSYTTHQESVSVNQFFLYVRDELIGSEKYEISQHTMSYELENGDNASITQYQNLVRRQVQGKGHEVYLRNVQQLSFKPVTYGLRISIRTLQGELYEKTLFIDQ